MYSSRKGAPGGAKSATRHYALWAKIVMADFNLAASTQIAKFNSPSNLLAIRYDTQVCIDELLVLYNLCVRGCVGVGMCV